MHDPENGRMQHWSPVSRLPSRVAHINELTNEELIRNVRGTLWVLNKASADAPQFGYTPFGHATRMDDGVLKVRIILSSSSKGGTYYSRGGILAIVKAAYWGILGPRPHENRRPPGIFASPQAGATTPVVTLDTSADGAHIKHLMIWSAKSDNTLVEPIAGMAGVKAPAVFFSVYINFPREPEPLGVAVTIAPTSLEGKLCRALGFFPDSAPWSPPVPLPALEVCVAIKHFFSMASTASMRFHNNKQAIEGLIAQGCANMHEYFGANGYNQLLSDIAAKRGDTQDWLPFLASANLTLAADEDDTDVPERRYVLAGLNGALALARASAARADLYTAAALADPKTASGAGATAPVPRTRTSTCTSTRAAASAPARQATEDASTAPQFGEVQLGDATAEPSGPVAASSTTTPPRQRADGADRANGGALEASPTSVIDGPNVTEALPAAEPPATDGTLAPGAPQLPAFARCARRDCACHFEGASFNGLPGHFCCRTCQRGTPCTFAWHTTPFQFDYIDPAAGTETAPDGAPTSDTTDAADAGALAARASAETLNRPPTRFPLPTTIRHLHPERRSYSPCIHIRHLHLHSYYRCAPACLALRVTLSPRALRQVAMPAATSLALPTRPPAP